MLDERLAGHAARVELAVHVLALADVRPQLLRLARGEKIDIIRVVETGILEKLDNTRVKDPSFILSSLCNQTQFRTCEPNQVVS